ncbi:MAG: hypothetical protein HRT35_05290 [Algicola sp.]|nr:hypothetical protein [Algicola sp.]
MNLIDSIFKGITDDDESIKMPIKSDESIVSVTMSSPSCIKHLPFILKSTTNQEVIDLQLDAAAVTVNLEE